MLVEDNALDVELLEIALQKNELPCVLNVCDDGEKALQYLYRQGAYHDVPPPDLMILDLNLPKKTGHEVLYEMSKEPSLQTIPVFVLTTTAHPKDVQRISVYPNSRILIKPTQFSEYREVIQSIRDCFLSTAQNADVPQ